MVPIPDRPVWWMVHGLVSLGDLVILTLLYMLIVFGVICLNGLIALIFMNMLIVLWLGHLAAPVLLNLLPL